MRATLLFIILFVQPCAPAAAYSILTHEAIIDASWKPVIIPALRARFPHVPEDSLQATRPFAYGGAIMPDMGYFPGGSRLFSDLMHYVRTGDFVKALLDSAGTDKEYAFALGALAHYTADRYGHPLGVNKAIPIMFPELKEEHGAVVNYAEDPKTHVRTEFGFDVLQTARGNYTPELYRQFIDFRIADSLLAGAFRATYAMEIDSLFKDYDGAVRSFRWAVKEVFPQLTRQAWKSRGRDIRSAQPTVSARRFRYRMRRAEFGKSYGTEITRPGFRARALAFAVRILPKIGPLKVLKSAIPGAEAEAVFIRSFDTVIQRYGGLVKSSKHIAPLNVNCDTGEPSVAGAYPLADEAYRACLLWLHEHRWAGLTPALKASILQYFEDADAVTSKEQELVDVLKELEGAQ